MDWIAFTADDIERDMRLFGGKTGQFVFISSASAYQKPPAHYLITEETPLDNPFWQYSRDKIACEERLMQAYRERRLPGHHHPPIADLRPVADSAVRRRAGSIRTPSSTA